MSEMSQAKFTCDSCGRSYTWKPELAGRRARCRCGATINVPQALPQEQDNQLYDLAPAEESARPKTTRVPLAPLAPKAAVSHAQAAPAAHPVVSSALAYQRGATERDRQRTSAISLLDLKRDVYVPVAVLVLGFVLYTGFYAIRYELSGTGIAMVGLGVNIITAFKAALLIGFALVAAGPLGVSFGGIYTAILKLAAVAVFCDGVTTWVDAGVARLAGGAGGAFSGMISFPVALAVYWILLIYMFSMDPGDSWMVVVLLAVFDFIVRMVLLMLLLRLVLSWGGISASAVPVPTLGGSPPAAADPVTEHVRQLRELNRLKEAREFMAGGRQVALGKYVEDWYNAGCLNVWFSVSPDVTGKFYADGLILELPKDKEKRVKCFEILKGYYQDMQIPHDATDLQDEGDRYLQVYIRT